MSILHAMDTLAKELKAYFSAFDGSKDWENRVKVNVEKLYHPDLVVVTADGEKDRKAMIDFVKQFTLDGGKAEDMSFDQIGDKLRYSGNLVHGDGTVSKIDSMGSYKDGKLIRIEPVKPTVYSAMMSKK